MSERWMIRKARPHSARPIVELEMPAEPADQDIVSSMRADRDAKPADHEDPGEVDPGQPAEDEREPGERLAGGSRRDAPARRAGPTTPSPPGCWPRAAGVCRSRSGREEQRDRGTAGTAPPRRPPRPGSRSPGRSPVADARRPCGQDSAAPPVPCENPRSTSLLSPTRATARTRLSTTMPSSIAGGNRQSRRSTACQPSRTETRPRAGTSGRSARGRPGPGASRRRPRSARRRPTRRPARGPRAHRPAGTAATKTRQGKGLRVVAQYERSSASAAADSPHQRWS